MIENVININMQKMIGLVAKECTHLLSSHNLHLGLVFIVPTNARLFILSKWKQATIDYSPLSHWYYGYDVKKLNFIKSWYEFGLPK